METFWPTPVVFRGGLTKHFRLTQEIAAVGRDADPDPSRACLVFQHSIVPPRAACACASRSAGGLKLWNYYKSDFYYVIGGWHLGLSESFRGKNRKKDGPPETKFPRKNDRKKTPPKEKKCRNTFQCTRLTLLSIYSQLLLHVARDLKTFQGHVSLLMETAHWLVLLTSGGRASYQICASCSSLSRLRWCLVPADMRRRRLCSQSRATS